MRYRPISADSIKPGDHIRVTLKRMQVLPATFCTTEGVVERLSGRKEGEERIPTEAHFKGDVGSIIVSNSTWGIWGLDLVLPDLPVVPGSAAKVFDPALLRDRLAVLYRVDGGGETKSWTEWRFADTDRRLDESERNTAEIVFDADPNV